MQLCVCMSRVCACACVHVRPRGLQGHIRTPAHLCSPLQVSTSSSVRPRVDSAACRSAAVTAPPSSDASWPYRDNSTPRSGTYGVQSRPPGQPSEPSCSGQERVHVLGSVRACAAAVCRPSPVRRTRGMCGRSALCGLLPCREKCEGVGRRCGAKRPPHTMRARSTSGSVPTCTARASSATAPGGACAARPSASQVASRWRSAWRAPSRRSGDAAGGGDWMKGAVVCA